MLLFSTHNHHFLMHKGGIIKDLKTYVFNAPVTIKQGHCVIIMFFFPLSCLDI